LRWDWARFSYETCEKFKFYLKFWAKL
jgi:hypothetical protein